MKALQGALEVQGDARASQLVLCRLNGAGIQKSIEGADAKHSLDPVPCASDLWQGREGLRGHLDDRTAIARHHSRMQLSRKALRVDGQREIRREGSVEHVA